jgi:hypothetical protein
VSAKVTPQRIGLRLSLDQLHNGGWVEVQLHLSSSRIAASRAETSTP